MGMYEIVLRGDNFLVEREGEKARMSFFATRFVEGGTVQDAELAAVDLIRSQLAEDVLNDPNDSPIISMEGYNSVAALDGVNAPGDCFAFFRATARREADGRAPRPKPKSRWRCWLEKD